MTWSVYQDLIGAYRNTDRTAGRTGLTQLIDTLKGGVPADLVELRTLGPTLHRRRDDVLTYFDRSASSNGPTETSNSRIEHLRGSAGFRNLTNYIARRLLEAGGFRGQLHPRLGGAEQVPGGWPRSGDVVL